MAATYLLRLKNFRQQMSNCKKGGNAVKIVKNETNEGILTVTLRIEPHEFEKALQDAYLENTDRFIVPGYAAGLAPRKKIEEAYGITALFDEALDLCVPKMYNDFLMENKIRIIGRPQLTEVTWMDGGGAAFTVCCDIYPEVTLGKYKGITVSCKREEDEEAFAAAVLTQACLDMKAHVPDGMIDQKLNAMIAQEKMRIGQDAIYHVLADCIEILEKAYYEADIHRPKAQIRAEALDAMLQTVSGDNKQVTKEFFTNLIKELVQRYRILPKSMGRTLEEIIDGRKQKKSVMTDEQKTDEAFNAYLGSLELTEKQWREQRREQAADAARFDLLFNAVAEHEGLSISTAELEAVYNDIAIHCAMEFEKVIAEIDPQPVKEQLLRDKARHLILDSAITQIE